MTGIEKILAGDVWIANTFQHQIYTSGISNTDGFRPSPKVLSDTLETIIPEKETSLQIDSILPDSLAGKMINFQVNSEISYLLFIHFVKNESKEMFYQTWLKELELKKVSIQTDSLRKVYAIASDEKKDETSFFILKNEEQSMALNQEISMLYQTARETEDQYWKNCSASEKVKFQEKIKACRDSISLSKIKEESEKASKIMVDSLFVSPETSGAKEVKTEITSAIVYKIQIGAFKGKIPDSSNAMIKKLSVLRKVENYTDEKGVKIYTTGNLKTYQEAVTMQSQVKQEGVKNPVIVAFQKGKKITVEEAKTLNKEL